MVDPQSWIRFSPKNGKYMDRQHIAWDNFSEVEFDSYLGSGCECTVCDQRIDASDPILPIKDFYYSGRDHPSKILNDDFYLLCSPVVHGYALNERKWGTNGINSPLSLSIVTDSHSWTSYRSSLRAQNRAWPILKPRPRRWNQGYNRGSRL